MMAIEINNERKERVTNRLKQIKKIEKLRIERKKARLQRKKKFEDG